MGPGTFLLLTGAFGLASASTAAIAIRSPSRWRFATPLTVGLSLAVAYAGLGEALGTARPVGLVPGWSRPDLAGGGAAVLSATEIGGSVVLTLQEGRGAAPRLYSLPATDELLDQLKRAEEAHAKAHGGEKFGFVMKGADGGDDGHTASGRGSGAQAGSASGSGMSAAASPYRFAEPAQATPPAKD